MTSFYQFETTELPIFLSSPDDKKVLDDFKEVIITLTQSDCISLEFDSESEQVEINPTDDTITVFLSQEDTGKFNTDKVIAMQLNILYNDTSRNVSIEDYITVLPNLHANIME